VSGGSDLSAPNDPAAPTLAPAGRRTLAEEVLLVLSLSLLPSAVDAVLSYFQAPVNRRVAVALYPSFPQFAFLRELLAVLFSIPPAWLVVHLARRSREGLDAFGLGLGTIGQDVAWGSAAAVAVAAVGLGVYLAAIALNVNRFVVPVPPLGHWWTIPILVLGALQTALLEEIVVLAYFIRRLEQLRVRTAAAVVASAVLRGSYHLYQGWGGFTGNLALGLAFGYAYARWRRTWPLVTAHFIVDTLAGLGYILFRGHCFGSLCIPK
jgi:membrane protease YdiL (CAAX protease family)